MVDISQETIMEKWSVKNSERPLVSIKCMAYNQENYISQCIDGFLIQKTDFPFEILIHDDCSTDRTAMIIDEYANKYPLIIKPIFENENQYSKPEPYAHHKKINAAIKGKYIAICEGDDYWTDPYKLQDQVRMLELNNYGLCYTQARVFYQETNKFASFSIGADYVSFENIVIKGNVIPTLTVCYRTDLYYEYLNDVKPENKNWMMGDLPLWLWFINNSSVYFFNRVTSVYRVRVESASHFVDKKKQIAFNQSCYDIRKYFVEKNHQEKLLLQYTRYANYQAALKDKNLFKVILNSFGISNTYLPFKERIFNMVKCLFIIKLMIRLRNCLFHR